MSEELGLGISNRGRSRGDSESRSSTEFSGISGLLPEGWPVICCGESFLFFVEDVVNASCLCSSEFAGGSSVGVEGARKDWKFPPDGRQRQGCRDQRTACSYLCPEKKRTEHQGRSGGRGRGFRWVSTEN
jgi:hypothetical protein